MVLMTVNAGSSVVRLDLFEVRGEPARLRGREVPAEESPEAVLESFLGGPGPPEIGAAAHRVVHGGRFREPRLLDEETEAEIGRLSSLAPLHNPRALRWIRACRGRLGPRPAQAAVFDTAFFSGLPPAAASYALPRELMRRHGLRRYGFHGLAHQSLWRRWRELRPDLPDGGRVISLQLGSGCSAAAIDRGEPKDTSMGFSPLEGLVMATRPGDVDPGALTYLQKAEGWTPERLEEVLYRFSGLLGASGLSGDMRELLEAGTEGARLALDLYVRRVRHYVGAYMAVLGGADGVLFGGGVGENSAPVRRMILAGMEWCGLELDEAANDAARGREGRVSARGDRIDAWVLRVDEAGVLAREALRVLSPAGAGAASRRT